MTVDPLLRREIQLPSNVYKASAYKQGDSCCKTFLLWVGDKTEWDMAAHAVVEKLSAEKSLVSIDLSARGDALLLFTADAQIIQGMLGNDFTVHQLMKLLLLCSSRFKMNTRCPIWMQLQDTVLGEPMMKFNASDHAQFCQDI